MPRIRSDAGLIGSINNPTISSASGMWSLKDQERALRAAQWPLTTVPPGVADPYFNYTSLLIHADGSNNANNTVFVDGSPNAYALTNTGRPYQGTFSPFSQTGWSNYFDGSTGFFTAPASSNWIFTGDLTIEAWVYPLDATSDQTVLATGGSASDDQFGYRAGNGSARLLYAFAKTGSVYLTQTGTIPVNQWSHIAVSRTGTTLRGFINGTQIYSGTISGSIGQNLINYTGKRSDNVNYVNGYISNLRAINGTGLYTTNFTPSTVPLTAVTNTVLLTCQDNRFKDNSTNAYTLTPAGTLSAQPFSPFAPGTPYSTTNVGGSTYYNGTTDYYTTSSATSSTYEMGSGDYTVECWFYALGNADGGLVFKGLYQTGATWQGGFGIRRLSATQLRFTFNTSTTGAGEKNYDYTTTTYPNQWYHVAMVVSSGTGYAYVNGTRVGTVASVGSIPTSSTGLTIGAFPYDAGYIYHNGYISNVRIFKGIALYTQSTYTIPTIPFVANSATSFLSSSTNAAIIDNTAKNNITTFGGVVTNTSPAKFGAGSMYFNGSTSYITVLPSQNFYFGTGDFTCEGWVYLNATATAGIFQIATSYLPSSALNSTAVGTNSNGTWQIYANGTNTNSALTYSTGQWYHFAIVRSGTTTTFYVNGVSAITVSSDTTSYTGTYLAIGGIFGGNYLNGYIDEFRISKYARYTTTFYPSTFIAFPDN